MIGERASQGVLSVKYNENPGLPHPTLAIESENGPKQIPVYSVREPLHHELIVKAATSGAVVAFEVGVMGVMIAINSDPKKEDSNWKKFWEVKKGRNMIDKVPMLMLPEHQDELVDFDKLHPNYHYLKNPDARKKFFGVLPFHAILPIKDTAIRINKDAFVTTPEDTKKKPSDQYVSEPTVCIYFQGGDRVWVNIAQLANIYNPNVHLGISSLNDHGEHSPYDFDELVDYIRRKQRVDFEFIVRDPLVAKHKIRSSMTQLRLPLKGESQEIMIVRKGPISADTIERHTKHPVRVLDSAKLASRGYSDDVRLDEKVLNYLLEAS